MPRSKATSTTSWSQGIGYQAVYTLQACGVVGLATGVSKAGGSQTQNRTVLLTRGGEWGVSNLSVTIISPPHLERMAIRG